MLLQQGEITSRGGEQRTATRQVGCFAGGHSAQILRGESVTQRSASVATRRNTHSPGAVVWGQAFARLRFSRTLVSTTPSGNQRCVLGAATAAILRSVMSHDAGGPAQRHSTRK